MSLILNIILIIVVIGILWSKTALEYFDTYSKPIYTGFGTIATILSFLISSIIMVTGFFWGKKLKKVHTEINFKNNKINYIDKLKALRNNFKDDFDYFKEEEKKIASITNDTIDLLNELQEFLPKYRIYLKYKIKKLIDILHDKNKIYNQNIKISQLLSEILKIINKREEIL